MRLSRHAVEESGSMSATVRVGKLGAVLALFSGISRIQNEEEIRVVDIDDDSLLTPWPSEDTFPGQGELAPECNFYNGSVAYRSKLCTHFVVSRASSSPVAAFRRASRCASVFKSECVLSPEIGLAVPAAFLTTQSGDPELVLAPRILDQGGGVATIRVHDPTTTLSSKVYEFNRSVNAEYISSKREIVTTTFHGPQAYCVQLLRRAFDDSCWAALD